MENNKNLNVFIDNNIKIQFKCNENPKLLNFIKEDFLFYEVDKDINPDIFIEILYGEFDLNEKFAYFGESILVSDKQIAVRYNASLREVWVEYSIDPFLGKNIKIHFPEKWKDESFIYSIKKDIFKFLFPNFMYRWQNALIDFIHGPLLGIINLNLLKREAALIHSAAIVNENNIGVLLSGWAQSGKSTLVDILIKETPWSFLGEDLCIINNDNQMIMFPKRRRLFYEKLKDTKYYNNKLSKFESKIDMFQGFLFNLFNNFKIFNLKPKRILSIKDLYKKNKIREKADIGYSLYLIRGNFKKVNLKPISHQEMANMCSNNITYEMKNFNNFYELLTVYGTIKSENTLGNFTNDIYNRYLEIFKNNENYILRVPTYNDYTKLEGLTELFYKKFK